MGQYSMQRRQPLQRSWSMVIEPLTAVPEGIGNGTLRQGACQQLMGLASPPPPAKPDGASPSIPEETERTHCGMGLASPPPPANPFHLLACLVAIAESRLSCQRRKRYIVVSLTYRYCVGTSKKLKKVRKAPLPGRARAGLSGSFIATEDNCR